jgi:hypothetical protein
MDRLNCDFHKINLSAASPSPRQSRQLHSNRRPPSAYQFSCTQKKVFHAKPKMSFLSGLLPAQQKQQVSN